MSTKKKEISISRGLSQKQQEEYFEEVYKEYFDRLYAYALIITKSENLAKDVVSEVFLNLWRTKIDLCSIKELKSYLFTSIKNQSLKVLSNDPASFRNEDYEQLTSSIDKMNPEELLVGKELEQFLNDVIEKIPPQCALVFKMVKEDNMKYEDVATELGISKDTVKYHVKVALKKIRIELDDFFTDTPVLQRIVSGSMFLGFFEALITYL